jgi:Flp pilus assembly protein TadD
MDDQFYKSLKFIAIFLVVGFIAFSVYDGLIRGKDTYTLAMGAGHRYFEDGQYREAISEFESALQVKPADPPANYGVAISQMQLGSNELALRYFDLAISAETDSTNKASNSCSAAAGIISSP